MLELDLKTLRLGPRSMPCEIKAFLNEPIDINHPMLTRAFARVLQHILDDGIRASAMMHDFIEIALQRVGQFIDFGSGFIVEWHTLADRALRNPIAGLSEVCACTASGQPAEPTITLMNSRRLIAASEAQDGPSYRVKSADWKGL